jgi:hypothetical protein
MKTAELHTCLEMDDPDVLIGSETWLDNSVHNNEIFPSNYTIFRKDRPPNEKGLTYGGVLIAVKSKFICAQRHDLDTNCEVLWVEMSVVRSKPILIGSFYWPPKTKKEYLNMIKLSLDKINVDHYSNIWLGGDFNLGEIVWETQSVRPLAKKGPLCRDLIYIYSQ